MRAHAKLSPSAAARWLVCTAAPALEAELPDKTSEYAEEGTFAHSVAETCAAYAVGQIAKSTYTRRLNQFKKNEWFSQELLDYAEEYASIVKETYLLEKETCPDAFCELEVKLDLSGYVPKGFGTADCIIVSEPNLTVIDFKYGKGVPVYAEDNAQMELYALGALEKYDAIYGIKTVYMGIIQPRIANNNSAERTADELYAWGETVVKVKAKEAYEGPGKAVASDEACRFCKAQGSCETRAAYFVDMFEENEDAPNGLLPLEKIGELLERAKDMENWLAALKDTVFDALMKDEKVSGWKLVEGPSRRRYKDESAAAEALKAAGLSDDKIFDIKVKSITSVEKELGKKNAAEILAPVVIKPPGKPTLAPASDKRPEYSTEDSTLAAFDEE